MLKSNKEAVNQQQDSSLSVEAAKLPKFEGIIKMEIEVDAVYNRMLNTLPEDYKHKEILAHAIIGTAQEGHQLHFIYNALGGYTNDIDFAVNDIVICTSADRHAYQLIKSPATAGESTPKPEYNKELVEVGECEVIEINLYAKWQKLKVRFIQLDQEGYPEERETWVDHKKCTRIPRSQSMVYPAH